MAVNTILNKSLTTFNQTDYLLKCDLLNKYSIKNIYDIPQYTAISIKYKNSFLFLENNINKFQVILFFYFILTYLPVIIYKPDTNKTVSLKLRLIDNQKIKILLENLMLENVIVLKKKLKKSVFNNEIFNQKKHMDFKLVFSVQNLYVNNELNLIFNDLYSGNLERITLYTSFNINRTLYNRLVGSSKEDFLKNFLYFWSF